MGSEFCLATDDGECIQDTCYCEICDPKEDSSKDEKAKEAEKSQDSEDMDVDEDEKSSHNDHCQLREQVQNMKGVFDADWGSGGGGFQSMYDSLLSVRLFLLQRVTQLMLSIETAETINSNPLFFDLEASWTMLKKDSKKQAYPSGDESSVTSMQVKDPTKWLVPPPQDSPEKASSRKRKRSPPQAGKVMDEKQVMAEVAEDVKCIQLLENWYHLQEKDSSVIPEPTAKLMDLPLILQNALTNDRIPHLRGLLILCQFKWKIRMREVCWYSDEIHQLYQFFRFYQTQVKETIFHWNLKKFYKLLRTAHALNVCIVYT
jgi:hypothetical protein